MQLLVVRTERIYSRQIKYALILSMREPSSTKSIKLTTRFGGAPSYQNYSLYPAYNGGGGGGE